MIYCILKIWEPQYFIMSEEKIIEFIQPDAQDWEKLERVSEIDMQGFGEDGISTFNLSQFARGGSVFCLTLNGLIIAEAVVLRNFRDDGAEIFGFAVAKEYFNQGYGTKLLIHLKEVAKETGIKYFELTMNPDRPVLHRLYIQKANFYKKAELTPHPHKHEPRWLLRYDI